MGIFNSYVSFPEGHISSNRPLKSQRQANVDVVFPGLVNVDLQLFSTLVVFWKTEPILPSGKHTKNYGKSQILMGKLTINGHFQQLC